MVLRFRGWSNCVVAGSVAAAGLRALLVALTLFSAMPSRAQICTGDCDATGGVFVDEVLRCVAIALGYVTLSQCDACDRDGDAQVMVNEVGAAVSYALSSCPTANPPSAVARFELSDGAPLDWGAVPFPSDLYRDQSGAVRLGTLPLSGDEKPLHAAMRELVQTRDGFCATCNVYFAIDGAIDPTTLVASDPPALTDAVLLADVDPASPERGRLFALRTEWDAERQRLAVRPAPGIALHKSRRYAAMLTTALHAPDGTPLGASETFLQVRQRSGGAAAVSAARAVLAPAFDELQRIGLGRNRIVALAAYTTQDVTADILAARAAVQAEPALAVQIERRRSGAEIDELLGIPGENRPGIDVPPAVGQGGSRSIAHDQLSEVITGSLFAPRLLTGSGTDIGTVRRDEAGGINPGPREAVPFVLTLPRTPAGSAMPLIVVHHGFSASRVTGFAWANTAARAGVAVLAIDGFQHGDRAASAVDERHAIRGDVPGADGFAETTALDVTAHVFGLFGAAPGLELFMGYSLGAFLQFEADVSAAVRIVRDGTLADALRAAGIAGADFDPQRLGFAGNSLGAVVGASVLTAEPDVRFAVQNVPPGSIVETLAESTEFRPLVDSVFLPLIGVTGPFDEVNRHLLFDPIVDLSRWILEPIDPLALAPYLIKAPVHGGNAPQILFQVAGLDEVAAPRPTESMLAATGSTRVTRYDPAAHGMLEVLNQSSRYVPPSAPPFVLRPAEIPVANPLGAEHQEIADFLAEQVASE
jgi:hypothetical protein